MTLNPAANAAPERTDGLLDRAFLALCLICFLNHFFTSPFGALFPVYVEVDLGRLPWFTGYLRGIMLALGGLFALVGGHLCDRFGRKVTLLIGLGGAALTGQVFRYGDPLGLTGLIFFMGAAVGPYSTAGQSYLISAVHPRRLGLGSALYFLSNTAGGALGSLVTGVLSSRLPFSRIGTLMSLSVTALIILAIVLLPSDSASRVHTQAVTEGSLWSRYRPLLIRREVHLLIGLRYMITSFWGMATLLMPLLIFRVSGSKATAAYYSSVSLGVAAACQLLTGVLADRYGRVGPLLTAAAGIALSALGLALSWHSLTGLFLYGTALTGTAWAVSTLIPKLMNDVAGPEEKNRLVGLTHLVWSAAMLTGSIVGGILVEVTPALPFLVGAALASGGTLCAWRLCLRLEPGGR